jgi:hypothetical protein
MCVNFLAKIYKPGIFGNSKPISIIALIILVFDIQANSIEFFRE